MLQQTANPAPYMFQQFPSWVTGPNGEQKIVQSQDELTALGDGWAIPEQSAPVAHVDSPGFVEYPKWIDGNLVNSADEEAALLGTDTEATREALLQVAQEKGIKVDGRWSDDKIRAALVAA